MWKKKHAGICLQTRKKALSKDSTGGHFQFGFTGFWDGVKQVCVVKAAQSLAVFQ